MGNDGSNEPNWESGQLRELHSIGGWKLVTSIVETFARTRRTDYDALAASSAHRNYADIALCAHRLKSTCSSVGGKRAARLCFELEMAGREHSDGNLDATLGELAGELDRVEESLREYVAAKVVR